MDFHFSHLVSVEFEEWLEIEQKQNDPSLSEIENQENVNSDVEPEVLSDVTDEGEINVEEL